MLKFFVNTILFILAFSYYSFSQQFNVAENCTLIIGELFGRVNPNNIEYLVNTNYYPISYTPNKRLYRLVKHSQREIVFAAVNRPPFQPQQIVFRFFNTEMALTAAIITDEIDFAATESAQIANEVHKSNPSVRVLFKNKPKNYVKMIAYNNRHPIFRNKNVRIALSCAINKHYILNNLLNNQADITSAPVDKESKLYVSKFKEYKYYPRKAIKLLEKEGWRDLNFDGILKKNNRTLHFTLIYEKGVLPDENMVRMIKFDWNKIGIDVAIKPLRKKEIEAKLKSRDFEAILTNYHFNETIENFEYIFASKGEGNFLGYNNKRIDRFLNLAKQATSPTKESLLQGVVNTIIQDQPVSFLFFLWMDWYFVNAIKFENFENENRELLPFTEWKLRQK